MKTKIQLTDSVHDVMFKMSEGNPGALTVCLQMLKEGEQIDQVRQAVENHGEGINLEEICAKVCERLPAFKLAVAP